MRLLVCERAGHVYTLLVQLVSPSVLSLRNSAVPFSRPCSLSRLSASQFPCSRAVVAGLRPVTRVVRRRCRAAAVCVACLCLAGCNAAATRVQARGVSSCACAWGGVVGDVVARSDVHAGIALARPRGLFGLLVVVGAASGIVS